MMMKKRERNAGVMSLIDEKGCDLVHNWRNMDISFMASGVSLEKRSNDQSILDVEGRKTTFSPLKINNISL